MLYTEQTPNPEALKYVTNRLLYRGIADFKEKDLAAEWSPMANSLMELPYVKSVYFNNNYVTITKEFNYDWAEIMLKLKEFVKEYVENGGTVVIGGIFTQTNQEEINKVPLLGDIPYMGWLFKNRLLSTKKTELLVFITPKIITDRIAAR